MVTYNVYIPSDSKEQCITAIRKDMVYHLPVGPRRTRTSALDKLQNPRLGPFYQFSHGEFMCIRIIVRDSKCIPDNFREDILNSLNGAAAGVTPNVKMN